ncbi:hypothetical protein [Rhizobium sp.]
MTKIFAYVLFAIVTFSTSVSMMTASTETAAACDSVSFCNQGALKK